MRANLTIIAAILVFSVWSTPAEAERRCLCGRPPTENVYEGLLAADFTPVDASAQFQPSALRDAKLAVISSSNFNEYARRWAYWYDEDNIDRYWAFQLFGQTRDNTREYEENTDPRRFGERLVVLLEPYVDQVVIAPDLQQAREQGYDVKIGKFPFSANGKATILGQRNGFIKVVSEKKYDEVLGIHIIGPHATELIAEGGVALSHEATAESLMRTIHAHPTLYEALGEAEHAAAEGAAIHI